MPTGTCRYPQHHGPGAGPPLGLILAIAVGALIITHVHAVVVTLAVVAVLAVLGGLAAMLLHSHRSVPYGASCSDSEPQSALQVTPARQLSARVAELEAQLAERRAIEAPQQHLHLHGVSAQELAAAIRANRQAAEEIR